MLKVENLRVSYGDIEAVHGVSLEVGPGELVSVIGANGAGKTSLLGALMGWVPASGSIVFDGEEISSLAPHHRARRGIRIVPERARIFPQLSVRENLRAGVYGLKIGEESFRRRLDELYALFPILQERGGQLASTLSGGEQQQLAIARALVAEPRLLLVDEVSMGLMPKLVDEVFAVLRRLNREKGLPVLLVEQNARASLAISDRAYVLETGNLVLSGTAEELEHDARVREAYLGL
ncbi:MAG TPA: ABC transporter ATP-binding protein [Synergistaceae bacterium]|nr:ABC transporter ATP-binding protein [Synergistaceae bacterium]HQH78882.1 ABC transporter ATP-binding protein [Synergistaceae bacterium]HQK24955.1 ABC transporter ATP-binding protein [Synergistaceae bacterium]